MDQPTHFQSYLGFYEWDMDQPTHFQSYLGFYECDMDQPTHFQIYLGFSECFYVAKPLTLHCVFIIACCRHVSG